MHVKLNQMIDTIVQFDYYCFNYVLLKKYNRNITISSEWCHANAFSNGFNRYSQDVANGSYCHDWKRQELIETVIIALGTRFMCDPKSFHTFSNGTLSSNIIRSLV